MRNKLVVIVDEVRTTIKQTFDDKSVTRAQVAHMVIITANKLLKGRIEKISSGKFLKTYFVPIELAGKRKFIRVPVGFFDFDKDGGIEYMATYDPTGEDGGDSPVYTIKKIQRATPSSIEWASMSSFTKPSAKEVYFWVSGENVNLVGLEGVPVKMVEIGVYEPISPVEIIDLNSEFEFPEDLLDDLKRRVVDMARFSYLFPVDTKNDGRDTSSDPGSKAPGKITSVNDQ